MVARVQAGFTSGGGLTPAKRRSATTAANRRRNLTGAALRAAPLHLPAVLQVAYDPSPSLSGSWTRRRKQIHCCPRRKRGVAIRGRPERSPLLTGAPCLCNALIRSKAVRRIPGQRAARKNLTDIRLMPGRRPAARFARCRPQPTGKCMSTWRIA